ncbi:MAG TPA: hypothetical protein VMS18_21860 [Candidatus Binatia bacterium]|nr:hypothetical protein [Candidatus Binatia bacterium]
MQNVLTQQGLDYERIIQDFGQVAASEARANGRVFDLRDHVRGLLLSQLSNQRPWKPIAQNLCKISRIFLAYDPDALQQAKPESLANAVCTIRCGNRSILQQMNALAGNIATLRRLEQDFGSLDSFVTSDSPFAIARTLSTSRRYKMNFVGPALALEYLRNVGIRAAKPDVHVLRILGGERLGYFHGQPTEEQAVTLVAGLADESGCNATYFDNLLWLFCATNYGNICGARPRCGVCRFRQSCRHPADHPVLSGS